jgi:hypothetical protein
MSQTREFHSASAQGLAGGSQFVYCGASIDALLAQNAHVVISPSSFLVQYWVNCLLLYPRQPEEGDTAGGFNDWATVVPEARTGKVYCRIDSSKHPRQEVDLATSYTIIPQWCADDGGSPVYQVELPYVWARKLSPLSDHHPLHALSVMSQLLASEDRSASAPLCELSTTLSRHQLVGVDVTWCREAVNATDFHGHQGTQPAR